MHERERTIMQVAASSKTMIFKFVVAQQVQVAEGKSIPFHLVLLRQSNFQRLLNIKKKCITKNDGDLIYS